MTQPSWTSTMFTVEFLSRRKYACPKCRATLSLQGDFMEQAADFLMDQCSTCGTSIIINQLDPVHVRIEGFANPLDLITRLADLSEEYSKKHGR